MNRGRDGAGGGINLMPGMNGYSFDSNFARLFHQSVGH
jgi:hypothetical protein